jgi:aminotransferase
VAVQRRARPVSSFLATRVSASQQKDVQREALQQMAEGHKDLVRLGLGDPDLPTPAHIVQAAMRALENRDTRYTLWHGREDLRRAISDRYHRDYSIPINWEQVVITSGGQEAFQVILQSILEPGDEAILAEPHYWSYSRAIRLAGGTPAFVPTDEAGRFVMQPADVVRRITPRTKVLIVVSPNNPTGAVIPPETLAELADIAKEHDLFVVSDEIYERWVFDGAVHRSIASFPGMLERTAIVNSFSKTYSMTGYRIGYLIVPLAIAPAMEVYRHTTSICAPTISQVAALAALTGPQDAVDEMHRIYAERRRVLVDGFNSLGLSCRGSAGGLYVYANISSIPLSAYDFCVRLLDSGVQLFPGTAFGTADGYVRAAFLESADRLQLAIDRMAPVVRALRGS